MYLERSKVGAIDVVASGPSSDTIAVLAELPSVDGPATAPALKRWMEARIEGIRSKVGQKEASEKPKVGRRPGRRAYWGDNCRTSAVGIYTIGLFPQQDARAPHWTERGASGRPREAATSAW
jgi:hypothetical protein